MFGGQVVQLGDCFAGCLASNQPKHQSGALIVWWYIMYERSANRQQFEAP